MTNKDILSKLVKKQKSFELDGIELTDEDVENVVKLINKGISEDSAIDMILLGIRETLDNGLDEEEQKHINSRN